MNTKILSLILLFTFTLSKAENSNTQNQNLKKCLKEQWGIDSHTSNYICDKFNASFNSENTSIVEDFINKSKKMNIDYSTIKEATIINSQDGVIQAPNQHIVLFENPWVRVLYGSSQPKEKENYHVHIWKSLMIVMKPTTYEIKYSNGGTEISEWPIGVYELGENEGYECTNVGDNADECLRFEVK